MPLTPFPHFSLKWQRSRVLASPLGYPWQGAPHARVMRMLIKSAFLSLIRLCWADLQARPQVLRWVEEKDFFPSLHWNESFHFTSAVFFQWSANILYAQEKNLTFS